MPLSPECFLGSDPILRRQALYEALGGTECFLGLPPEQQEQKIYEALGGEACFLGVPRELRDQAIYTALGGTGCFLGLSQDERRYVLYQAAGGTDECFRGSSPQIQELLFYTAVYEGLQLGAGITVEWEDNSDDEDGFRIYYGTDGGATFPFTVEVGPNVTIKNIGNLINGQEYCFYVVAFNGAGESAPTATECAIAGTAAPDVTAPTLVSATVGVDGVSFTEVYSEAVEAGADGFVTGFTINTDGAPVTKTYVSGTGTTTLVYSLDDTVLDVDTLTLDYTQPGDGIQDASANLLATFSNAAVTNNSTQSGGNYLVDEGFEGAGTPSGWTIISGTPDPDDATTVLVGSQQLRMVSAGAAQGIKSAAFADQDDCWLSCEFRIRTMSGNGHWFGVMDAAETASTCFANIETGTAKLFTNSGFSAASATTIANDTHYRLQVHFVRNATSTLYIYPVASSRPVVDGSGSVLLTKASEDMAVGKAQFNISAGSNANIEIDRVIVSATDPGEAP